jgi:hypothetical protein
MEQVETLFGNLHLKKVGTFHVSALGKPQDVFVARLKNSTNDSICAIVMTNHEQGNRDLVVAKELDWTSFEVRTYVTKANMFKALSSIVNAKVLDSITVQKLKVVEWGNQKDFDLKAVSSSQQSKEYVAKADVPFKVVLHSVRHNNKNGNELEVALEFIPALQSLNFTLLKR